MKGHHLTHCQYCNREYVCGDCITTNCELGRDKRKCEHYQAYVGQRRASAVLMEKMANDASKTTKQHGMARLLGGLAWDDACKDLSNLELADALKTKVWANMKLGTEELALLEQAIDRLEGKNDRA